MNKQVEAIRAEIERQLEYFKGKEDDAWDDCDNYTDEDAWWYQGHWKMCAKLLTFINSLPEEPSKGLDVTDFCKPIDPGIAQCIADNWWEMLGEDEQPDHIADASKKVSKDLEQAARRYAIPSYMKDVDEDYLEEYPYDKIAEASFIAGAQWQKEQKPNIELIQRSWYMEGYHDREFGKEPKWIIKAGEGGPKHELNPKYGKKLAEEQKPANGCKGPRGRRGDVPMDIRRKAEAFQRTMNPPYDSDDICSAYETGAMEQKSTEWSDTDNIGWDEAFACVTRAEKAAKNEEELQNAVTAEKWLKEIKFKYYVHPVKQEWSEEDEFFRQQLIVYCEKGIQDTLAAECVNWLKSLKNRGNSPKSNANSPCWKPSEEQMESLRATIVNTKGYSYSIYLPELYEQLKKLMEDRKPVEPSIDELQRHEEEFYNFKVFATKQAREHHISFVHDFEWNNFCEELLSYFNENIAWQKTLSERFNFQPKQEWGEFEKPNWKRAKAGTLFPSEALVIGDDGEARLSKVAVNDCKYILVKHLLPKEDE